MPVNHWVRGSSPCWEPKFKMVVFLRKSGHLFLELNVFSEYKKGKKQEGSFDPPYSLPSLFFYNRSVIKLNADVLDNAVLP